MKYSVLLLALLAGCATKSTLNSNQAREANEPLFCEGKDQCDTYWQRAQIFVATHSKWKIQIANDTLIQTYGPGQYDTASAFSIMKEPSGSDKYRIKISVGCNNPIRCIPLPIDAAYAFKKYVKEGN